MKPKSMETGIRSAMKSKPTILLVHGAFHGAWCWDLVVEGLMALDLDVRSFDLPGHGRSQQPLGGMSDDARAVSEAIAACPGPVLLCGHSYGGTLITEAADPDHQVQHLVYLAAAIPDVGESTLDLFPEVLGGPLTESLQNTETDAVRVDPARAVDIFYHDCDEEMAAWAASRMDAQTWETVTDSVSRAPWREIDCTYVICTEDRVLPAAAQQRLAKRCRRSVEWSTGHSPMLNDPARVVSLLADLTA